jgi:hypothetical protein
MTAQARRARSKMARVYTVRSPQWWKHLRKWKRIFWKKERKASARVARKSAYA